MSGPGVSWKQSKPDGVFDAIVIGSGIGGLTTAALLARHGRKRVLVCERHYRLGGYTHTFTRPGYEWDVGVHYVGQVGERGALRGAFDHLTLGRLRWAKLPDVYDRIELGGRGYDLRAGTGPFIEGLCAAFPKEARVIKRYVSMVKWTAAQSAAFHLARGLTGVVQSLASPLASWRFSRHARRTTAEVLGELTDNVELKAVLCGQYGDYGLPPTRSSWGMHAAVVGHYLGGGYYPIGGSASFAATFAPVIEAQGGHLATCATVNQILVEGGRAVGVRLEDGSEVRAPLIVSDAGAWNTFGHLLAEKDRPAELMRALQSETRSVSYFGLYLGFRHTDEQLGLNGTNLWLYPDERHDENATRFEADPTAPFPVVYVSFPSAKDPEWATRYPGRSTVDVITMARFDWYQRWANTAWRKRGADYEAQKREVTDRLLEVVYQRLPQLRGKVDVVEASTPLSAANFAGHARGELYGLDHSPIRHTLPLTPRTPVEGLVLSGADVGTCGVAGAMLGGLVAASSVLGGSLMGKVLKPSPRR